MRSLLTMLLLATLSACAIPVECHDCDQQNEAPQPVAPPVGTFAFSPSVSGVYLYPMIGIGDPAQITPTDPSEIDTGQEFSLSPGEARIEWDWTGGRSGATYIIETAEPGFQRVHEFTIIDASAVLFDWLRPIEE